MFLLYMLDGGESEVIGYAADLPRNDDNECRVVVESVGQGVNVRAHSGA